MIIRKVNEDVSIGCEVFSSSRAWGHIVKCFWRGSEIAENRVRYYNRTWERYQFQSAMQGLVYKLDKSKAIPLSDRFAMIQAINNNEFIYN